MHANGGGEQTLVYAYKCELLSRTFFYWRNFMPFSDIVRAKLSGFFAF